MRKYMLAATVALLGLVPLAASAQEAPSYANQPYGGQQPYPDSQYPDQQYPDQRYPDQQQPPPPDQTYGDPNAGGDEQIRGRILNFDGGYNVTVRDDRGFIDSISLHDGTIINPTGLTLAPGMVVSILGVNEGSQFSANEIDTPYTIDADVPYYAGHPWDYYGPSFDLGFFFGNAGWWHGGAFVGPYRYSGGIRIYANVHIGGGYGGRGYDGNRGGYRGGYGYAGRPNYDHAAYGANGYRGGYERTNGNGTYASADRRYPTTRSYQTAPNRSYQTAPVRSYQSENRSYQGENRAYQSAQNRSYAPAAGGYRGSYGGGYAARGNTGGYAGRGNAGGGYAGRGNAGGGYAGRGNAGGNNAARGNGGGNGGGGNRSSEGRDRR